MSAGTSNTGNKNSLNPSVTGNQGAASSASGDILSQSKDVQTMISVLKDMGVEEFEPRVVNQLLEFSYRYITNLLEDAKAFSNHAGKKTIDSEDIKMAIKSKVDYSFTTTPPRDLLMEISKSKNRNPLPPIKYHAGIRLPPDRFCLHAQNYTLKTHNIQSESESNFYSVGQSSVGQVRSYQNNSNVTSTAAARGSEGGSFIPPNISIKRPRADEDDYDI